MEKYGIEHSKKFLAMLIELGNIADKMGRLKGMARYMHITQLFDEMTAMADFKFAEMKKEIDDYSVEEMAELENFIVEKFNIEKDELEKVIEKAFAIGLKVYGLLDELKLLLKKEEKVAPVEPQKPVE